MACRSESPPERRYIHLGIFTSGGASLGGGKGAAVDALAEPADAGSAGALASELGV